MGLLSRLRAEQVPLATVEVDDRIRIHEAAPPIVHVGLARKVRFVVVFSLADATPHVEEYTLRLETRLDRGPWSRDERTHETGPVRRSVEGRLVFPVRFLSSGDRLLEYRLHVAYDVRARGTGQPILLDRKEVSGRLTLRVGNHDRERRLLGVGA